MFFDKVSRGARTRVARSVSPHICNLIHAANTDGLWATAAHCIVTTVDSRSVVCSDSPVRRQARTHCGFLPWL